MYVASRVAGTGWLDALFGSMLPDLDKLASTPTIKSKTAHLAHFEFDRLPASTFALGFATHNGVWGADYYAHSYHDPEAEDTYLTSRMRLLTHEFGFTMNEAEGILEAVVDYLVRKDWGPELGALIEASADYCGASYEQEIVDAFAQPLSERVPGLSLSEAEGELRAMYQGFQTVMRAYGRGLYTVDLETTRGLLVEGMAMYFEVDEETANEYMTRAEELCWDYDVELDRIADTLPAELAALSCTLPLSRTGVLVAGLLICGLLRALARREPVRG